MSDKKSIDLGLTSALDELFMDDQGRKENALPKIYDIPLSEIDDFPDHPFHVRNDEDMDQLVESIKERGIITPVMLRQKEDGRFEMVSGHRRKRACELAGMETISFALTIAKPDYISSDNETYPLNASCANCMN